MTPDVNTRLVDFKDCKGKEFVVVNEDGSYTVVINSRLSNDAQLQAYNHAMEHIIDDDFSKTDVQEIELKAHHLSDQKSSLEETKKESEYTFTPEQIKRLEERHRRLQARIRRNKRRLEEDMARVEFLQEYCDVFALEAHRRRYGIDL